MRWLRWFCLYLSSGENHSFTHTHKYDKYLAPAVSCSLLAHLVLTLHSPKSLSYNILISSFFAFERNSCFFAHFISLFDTIHWQFIRLSATRKLLCWNVNSIFVNVNTHTHIHSSTEFLSSMHWSLDIIYLQFLLWLAAGCWLLMIINNFND